MRRDGPLKPDFSAVRGRRILIALSGGADSVALACLLAEARPEYGLTLFAAHVDHGIRPDSAEDAEFCQALCADLDIPFLCARADVPASARANRAGLESEARRLRYQALRRFRQETGCDCIALAHHMDDQAETVLMHLSRGAGTRGLAGMRALSGDLYRPLLGLRKSELADYLRQAGRSWREDSTNRLDDNPRNALRLHVIPELEKCYPQFAAAAARCALSAQIESDYLDEQTAAFLSGAASECPFCSWIGIDPPPHRAVLRRAVRAKCPAELSWEQVNALEALCGRPRGKIDIDGKHFAERTGRRLYFVPKRPPRIDPVPLDPGGTVSLAGLCEITAQEAAPQPAFGDPMIQVLDAQALEGAVLRTRRPGDRFRPLGCGDRLLSDFLIDRKVDRPLRDALAIVARGGRALWVCGLGISEDAKIVPETRRALRLNCRYTFDMSFGINK